MSYNTTFTISPIYGPIIEATNSNFYIANDTNYLNNNAYKVTRTAYFGAVPNYTLTIQINSTTSPTLTASCPNQPTTTTSITNNRNSTQMDLSTYIQTPDVFMSVPNGGSIYQYSYPYTYRVDANNVISGTRNGNVFVYATAISIVRANIVTYICRDGYTFVDNTTTEVTDGTNVITGVQSGITMYYPQQYDNFSTSTSTIRVPMNINFVFLPVTSGNSGKMFFIKNKGTAHPNYPNPIHIIAPTGVMIDGQNTYKTGNDISCLTLMCDGTKYLIVNEYPSYNQPIVSRNTTISYSFPQDTTKTRKTAILNTINVFNVNDFPERYNLTFTNAVLLPNPTTPAMCIIVYAGDASLLASRSSNHPLYLFANNSIDGIAGDPYIYTDGNYKSAGIVLITDGTRWYIAGWMLGSGWNWTDTPTKGTSKNIPAFNGFLNSQTVRTQLLYAEAYSCLKIIKNTITSTTAKQYYSVADANDTSITNVYLNTTNSLSTISSYSMFYSGNNRNSCIWFACHVSGGNTYYYPVIGYTPN